MSRSFVRFLLVGVINTLVGYSVILGLQVEFGVARVPANALGYAFGIVLSYFLNRRYAFGSMVSHRTGLPRFFAVALVCFGLNLAVVWLVVDVMGKTLALGQAIAVAAYTLSFYALSRALVFHGTRDTASMDVRVEHERRRT